MHHLSRPMPKPLRFRSSCTPSRCSRTCWRHAGRAAARQHDPNNRGVVSFFWPYTATFYTAKNTAKNRCIALYTDTRCVTALHSYTALYTIQLYSYTALYTIQPLQHPSGRAPGRRPRRGVAASVRNLQPRVFLALGPVLWWIRRSAPCLQGGAPI